MILATAVGSAAGSAVRSVVRSVPVEPDADSARDWLLQELARAPYQAAKPNPIDVAAQAVWDWLTSLFSGGTGDFSGIIPLVLTVLVVGLLVAAFLSYGRPRLNRRSTSSGALFGVDDRRSAAELRAAARAAATAGDFSLAIQEQFRALARDLADRTVLTVTPGTTARGFAGRAADAFPALGDRFSSAAAAFDDVRYLGGVGSSAQYEHIVLLDEDARGRTPERLAPVGGSPERGR